MAPGDAKGYEAGSRLAVSMQVVGCFSHADAVHEESAVKEGGRHVWKHVYFGIFLHTVCFARRYTFAFMQL